MGFIAHLLVTAVLIFLLGRIVPGIRVRDGKAALMGALVLGIANAIVRPILVLLTLPVTILTLGLFLVVVNAVMLALAAWLVDGFEIEGFGAALWGAIVLAVCLIVAIFVGGIVGFAFYSVGKSEAATRAKEFLKNSAVLKQDIGEVTDFGSFVTGSINVQNANGAATLNLKVIGAKKTVHASVNLAYNGHTWRVSSASYVNDRGETVNLLDPYESNLMSDTLQFVVLMADTLQFVVTGAGDNFLWN